MIFVSELAPQMQSGQDTTQNSRPSALWHILMTTATPHTNILPRLQRSLFLTLLTGVFLHQPARAQPATAPTSPTTEEHQSLDPDTDHSLVNERTDRVRFTNESASHYYYSLPLPSEASYYFFPPVPPPLNAEFPLLGPLVRGAAAPPELAAFVDEPFYPMLGTRLSEGELPAALQARLQAYRNEKTGLQNELRAVITGLKGTALPEREQQLAVFAVSQTPRIAALEAKADKLRSDLRRTGIFGLRGDGADWTSKPGWHRSAGPDTPVPPDDLQLESEALRGAAYYQEGLSPAQRRLLREEAIELETAAHPALLNPQPVPEGWLLHFSPEPARIRIQANLPAPLAKKISEYVSAKKALQAELRDALQNPGDSASNARLESLKQLAVIQAPRITALETVAEEIRRELAALPNPPGPPAPPALPPELTVRISSYRTHKLELLKTLYAMLTGPARSGHPPSSNGSAQTGDPVERSMSWMHDSAIPTAVPPGNLRVPAEEFTRRQTELVGELNRELAGIREALADYVRAANQPVDRKSINDLLKDFENARQQQEVWDKYRDYQTAVLVPGLSPEQRRLLFSAAVEQLALPLPAGERAN